VTSSPELWSKYWPQYEELLKTVSFPSHTRLAEPKEGGIPLTMYTVNTCIDFCEWFMDVPYTDDQRAAMKQYMVDLWKGDDAKSKEEREGMQEVIKGSIEVAKLYEPQKKELARVAIRQEAIKQWREDGAKGDKMASFMIDIYDAANKPVAAAVQNVTVIADAKGGKEKIEFEKKGDALVSKDGEMLYYLARFERGLNMWSIAVQSQKAMAHSSRDRVDEASSPSPWRSAPRRFPRRSARPASAPLPAPRSPLPSASCRPRSLPRRGGGR